MNDRIYNQNPNKLRNKERIKRLEVDKVISICLKQGKIKTLLDIGTGSGLFAEAFYRNGIKVIGIDINKKMIKTAKLHLPKCKFLVASAESLPFRKNSFDAVFLGLVLHEVEDYYKTISEAFRVSKQYTFILEWKFKKEEHGPPIKHRLKSKFIEKLSNEAGYRGIIKKRLKNLILYILKK